MSCSDHSESVDDEDILQTPMRGDDAFNPANLNYKRPRMTTGEQSPEWFPWPDRTACTLDILMHLPRSAFSVRQLELFLWLLKVNGVADATSVKTMKDLDTRLQQLYGIQTFKYKGAFGHIYYVNSLADIISQEMCNPNVRPHLSFYPEDCASKNVSEARQFDRWLNEIPDNELGPMARIHGTDYYIFEPTMFRDGSVYMPHRWFRRMGRLYARCWKMEEIVREDGQTSWRVIKSNDRLEFDEEFFLKSFPTLLSDHQNGIYPLSTNPSMIEDVIDYTATPATICKWTSTNPVLGNPWRQRANGAQVLSYPIWLYCDDTSGNTSKRWNEHNSFLFTSAGLDRSESSKEYNVHFLATSNSAPPLEMLDGIADQIQDCQENGVWAWDPVTDSRVLLIVCVLALLGDNPMQSEFACHIGLRGKFFCRTCWVKGKDASADKGEEAVDGESNEEGAGHSDATSVASTGGKKKRTKFKESLQTMVSRVKAFVKPGKARTRTESIEALRSQFVEAQNPGAGTRVKSKRTETGLKDTYQTFFIDRLLNASKRRQGIEPRTALHDTLKDFPSETMSPVWRIRGLDPHTDTPVEILHVVLLGFIKYLWRDVIENQIKKNPEKKAELAARLSCINVDGLGLDSNLPGKTLVDYYGSLTGSDFRKISQVAPFVLKDFVSKDCFETWVALSKLVPLIWQPKITDLDSYIVTLEREIEQFLLYAAKWSIRWFNKPKFHILVHLPAHIRRFGPAMLFATEVFESYNAIIRAKSIHSNRLAPSRDIALAFAKQNRIRHMLSGGLFLDRTRVVSNKQADEDFNNIQLPQQARVTQVQQYFRLGAFNNEDWACVGKSVIEVASWSKESVGKYLGIFDAPKPSPGLVTLDPAAAEQHWFNTRSGRLVPDTDLFTGSEKSQGKFRQGKDVILVNGDRCMPRSYAACADQTLLPFACDAISIVRVHEILRIKQPGPLLADSILVEAMIVGTEPSVHGMPRLTYSGKFFVVRPTVLQCTVNVQHNCNQNNCQVEQVRAVLQERERTGEVRGAIVHRGDMHDVVLNTAQMRDAEFVQRFRLPGKVLSLEQELTGSAAREWDSLYKSRTTARHPPNSLQTSTRSPISSSNAGSSLPTSSGLSPARPSYATENPRPLTAHPTYSTAYPTHAFMHPRYPDNSSSQPFYPRVHTIHPHQVHPNHSSGQPNHSSAPRPLPRPLSGLRTITQEGSSSIHLHPVPVSGPVPAHPPLPHVPHAMNPVIPHINPLTLTTSHHLQSPSSSSQPRYPMFDSYSDSRGTHM
ncbi:hypothetical protein F5880DRAFT_396644 [Lentinula raphanica]|nr:hypothetical protein F5880DRAFT_396644 [Lentinula raphanica]